MELVPAPLQRDWMSSTPEGFARRCLPLLIANQHGWLVLNDVAFIASWDGSERPQGLVLRPEAGSTLGAAHSHFGSGILTWTLPYLFRTPPGFDLLLRGPANLPKDGISPLEGVVETDWTPATATMNWKLTRPGLEVCFAVGEPIAMIVPVRRGDVERFDPHIRAVDEYPALAEAYRRWWSGRNSFLQGVRRPGRRRDSWQGDYFAGEMEAMKPGRDPGHRRRLRVSPFTDFSAGPDERPVRKSEVEPSRAKATRVDKTRPLD